MSSIRLQEIMTRAVVGRTDRRVVWSHSAPAEGVECVLGVHVSNTSLAVEPGAQGPEVKLTALCDVWCDTGNGTRVERLTCTHTEPAAVPVVAQVVGEVETCGRLVGGVRCTSAEVRSGRIEVTLESHIALEATGRARIWVKAYDLLANGEADEEDNLLSTDASDSSTSTGEQAPLVDLEEEEVARDRAETADELEPEPELATLNAARRRLSSPPPSPRRTTAVSRFSRYSGVSRVSIVQ
ncbi:MAG: hypothetical protein AB2385_06250 [Symbiobacterium sp.]|uniref:hypothetical protein n=1 Tax=Symbiobacterium sp. TaxID=1971213 RepID=UPI0034645A16